MSGDCVETDHWGRIMLNALPIFLGDLGVFTQHHATAGFAVLVFALLAGVPRALVWLLPDLQ